jgi:hypothetical protein
MTLVQLEKQVRMLKLYAVAVTAVLLVLAIAGFRFVGRNSKFEEIDAERINIVEKDGKLKMVLSNNERQHPGTIDGHTVPRHESRGPGIIFFNDRGDECGGLTFDGDKKEGKTSAGGSLTFDRFRQDQTVGIQYIEEKGQRFAGLRVWDRPDTSLWDAVERIETLQKLPEGSEKTAALNKLNEAKARGEFGATRITIGTDANKVARIVLSDGEGKPRIRMSVGGAGNPSIEFLNDAGKVVYRLSPEDQPGRTP